MKALVSFTSVFIPSFVFTFVVFIGVALAAPGGWAAWRVGLMAACLCAPIITGITALMRWMNQG